MQQLKTIEQEQNAAVLDKAMLLTRIAQPKQGWIKTARTALSMSGAVLSQRLGGHRSIASYLERAEMDDSITLKKLKQAAEAMNCELVYAIVPKATAEQPVADVSALLARQAERKARSIVRRAGVQMALEAQALRASAQEKEVERLKNKLLNDMPRDFWTQGEFDEIP
jgi:predicted DNA-binding mobile mystery protein A